MEIEKVKGLVFKCPTTGEEYGTIRSRGEDSTPKGFPAEGLSPFADDDCGNIFTVSRDGKILFWDHETEEIKPLAESFEEFSDHCTEPEDVELKEGDVISVWVDPDFKPEFD
jgi:hypothetical protein